MRALPSACQKGSDKLVGGEVSSPARCRGSNRRFEPSAVSPRAKPKKPKGFHPPYHRAQRTRRWTRLKVREGCDPLELSGGTTVWREDTKRAFLFVSGFHTLSGGIRFVVIRSQRNFCGGVDIVDLIEYTLYRTVCVAGQVLILRAPVENNAITVFFLYHDCAHAKTAPGRIARPGA